MYQSAVQSEHSLHVHWTTEGIGRQLCSDGRRLAVELVRAIPKACVYLLRFFLEELFGDQCQKLCIWEL